MALCHINQPVPTFAQIDPTIEVPPSLESVVHRCLAKDPDLRYATADELVADLMAFRLGTLAAEPTGGFTLEGERTITPVPAPTRVQRRPWLAGGALGVALGALAGAVWWWSPAAPVVESAVVEAVVAESVELAPARPEPPAQAERVSWGERPTRWRGSAARRVLALDVVPGGADHALTATLTVHLDDGLQRHTLRGAATDAGDGEVALYLADVDGGDLWLTGIVSSEGAAGTLHVDGGGEPLSWVAGALREVQATQPAVEEQPTAPAQAAAPQGVKVEVAGDASRVYLVGVDDRRVRVPGRVIPGEYGVVALFPGSEPVEAGTVLVTDDVTLTCSSFAARCKPR
jgi:hypothetical protein